MISGIGAAQLLWGPPSPSGERPAWALSGLRAHLLILPHGRPFKRRFRDFRYYAFRQVELKRFRP
jgi:hypothetical protein